jgi:hypothetical protein
MSKLSREEIFETADLLYFGFMEFLCDSDRDNLLLMMKNLTVQKTQKKDRNFLILLNFI